MLTDIGRLVGIPAARNGTVLWGNYFGADPTSKIIIRSVSEREEHIKGTEKEIVLIQ